MRSQPTLMRFLLALGGVFSPYPLQWSWDPMADTGLFDGRG